MSAISLASRLRSRTHLATASRVLVIFLIITFILTVWWTQPVSQFRTKALVVASSSLDSNNVEWFSRLPLDWPVYHYITDGHSSSTLSVPLNKGNEAMVYLTYIIDHYDALPDVVFFHHNHHRAWHQSFDSVFEVHNLRTEYVLERGYVSTRCLTGCENIMPVADDAVEIEDIHLASRDVQLRTLLSKFLDEAVEIPGKIAAPCCAQFAASREAIRRRSLHWWKKLHQWLIDTPMASYDSGRLLEWTWHIWLGEESQFCSMSTEACLCNVFGHGEGCKYIGNEHSRGVFFAD